jgi:hypothetical protein
MHIFREISKAILCVARETNWDFGLEESPLPLFPTLKHELAAVTELLKGSRLLINMESLL